MRYIEIKLIFSNGSMALFLDITKLIFVSDLYIIGIIYKQDMALIMTSR